MWNDTWGWRQACAIVAALGVVGIVLQIAVGHIPQGAFVFPQNIIWGSAFLLAIVVSYVLLGRYNKQVQSFFRVRQRHSRPSADYWLCCS